ncbi:hypothetical protein EV360DRAFT_19558, partial [Lentinula raphanica]
LMSMKWIWSAEGAVANSMRAFRRTLPEGRSRAVCVTFAIAADDAYTVWVNGVEIGDNLRKGGDPAGSAFRELDIYSVSLSRTKNVIAVNASNYVDVSGVIFTGVVLYEDGSQVSFVSDNNWVTAGPVSPPDRFQEIDFDDSKWVAATIYGPVGMGPWGPVHLATLPNLDLMSMKWIWSAEGAVPSSMRAFRRTLPVGRSRAVCVTFAIAADDAYTVWVNGVEIGDNFRKGGDPAGSAFRELDIYSVSLSHTKNVIAVNASNYVDVSGVIFTGVVLYEDGSQTSFVSDSEWVTAGPVSPPPRFQEIDFDDSKWVAATIYGPVGMGPWG